MGFFFKKKKKIVNLSLKVKMFETTKWFFKALNREYKSAYTQNNFFRNPFKEKKITIH